MQIHEADRKTFRVKYTEVSLKDIEEIAKWCGGTIEQRPTKMMGTTTDLPVIMVPGVGEHRGESFPAALGCVIVEFKGSFRVYKPQQFQQAFDPVKKTVVLGNTIQEMTIGSDDVRHAMGIDTPVEI